MAMINREELDRIKNATKALEGYTKAVVDNNSALKKHEEFAKEVNDLSKEYNRLIEDSTKKAKKSNKDNLVAQAKLKKFTRDNTKDLKVKKKLTKELSDIQKKLTPEEKKEVEMLRTKYDMIGKNKDKQSADFKERKRQLITEAKHTEKIFKKDQKFAEERKKIFSTKGLEAYRRGFSKAVSGGNLKQAMTNFRGAMKKQMELATKSGKGLDVKVDENKIRRELFDSMAAVDIEKSLFGKFKDAEEKAMDKLARDYEKATTPDEKLRIASEARIQKKILDLDKKEAEEKAQAEEDAKLHIARTGPKSRGLETLTGMGREAKAGIKGAFSGDQAGVQKAGVQTGAWAKQAKEAGGALKVLGGGLEVLSKGLSMIGKLNWIFALIGGIKALISTMNDLDKFLKELNKAFLEMAGPAAAFNDVNKEMSNFNRAIFDLARNSKLGVLPEEVSGMFRSMSAAGMSLQGVGKRVGEYGTAIEAARKISLQFGVSLDQMGTDMTTQMVDLNASLTDVRKNFDSLAFDAAKAGISSTKFYQAIESAAMSLSYYGNNVKYVSGLLSDFYKVGNMGFKDAASTASKFSETFKNMSDSMRRQFIAVMKPEEIRKQFSDLVGETGKQLKDLTSELDSALANHDEARAKVLKEDIKKLDDMKTIYQSLADTKDTFKLQLGLPYLTKKIMPLMAAYLKRTGGSPTGESLGAFTELMKQFGFAQEDLQKGIIEPMEITKKLYSELDKSLLDNVESNKQSKKRLDDLALSYVNGTKSFKDIKDEMRGIFAKTGAPSEDIDKMMKAIEDNPAIITEGFSKGIDYLLNSFMSFYGTLNKGTTKLDQKGTDDIVHAITPMEKYIDIAKQAGKLAITDNALMKGIFLATTKSEEWLSQLAEGSGGKAKADTAKSAFFEKGGGLDNIENVVKSMIALEKVGGQGSEGYKSLSKILEGAKQDKWTGGLATQTEDKTRELEERKSKLKEELSSLSGKYTRGKPISYGAQEEYSSDMSRKADIEKQLSALGSARDYIMPPSTATKDGIAMSGGWRKLSRGDLVVHQDELAKTMDSRYGGLADRVAGTITPVSASSGDGSVSNEHNWGGVNINFNAPADASNPAAYRNLFVDAVEQIFNRKMYAEKHKVKK